MTALQAQVFPGMAMRRVSSSGAASTPEVDPVLQALPVGVAIVDADRRILFVNPAFHDALMEELLGIS